MITAIAKLFPALTCRIRTGEKILFLTFDDGPVPEATPAVLDMLQTFNAKAAFFCIGDNIRRHPGIYKRILSEGHAAGNHTFTHLNGWKASTREYTANIDRCAELQELQISAGSGYPLFRPPYGKLKPAQYTAVKRRYKIVLWDVLARDWEQDRNAESCFQRIERKARPGSIVVFHDSIKAKERMLPALERTLNHFSERGFRFESLVNYV
jgi:peptidoglycan/xylan/chitin deacetylase (PgdA/CDA1 family)